MVKRMNRDDENGMVTYRKLGGGDFIMKNRYIKPNQVFKARPEDIPDGFKDVIVPVSGSEEEKVRKETVEKDVKKTEYSLKHKGGGWYVISDGDGKIISEKAMKEDAAKEVLKGLE